MCECNYIFILYIQIIGGSSYIRGCNVTNPITYLSGISDTTTNTQTLPVGSFTWCLKRWKKCCTSITRREWS